MVRRIRRWSFVPIACAAFAWLLGGTTVVLADDSTQTFPLNVTCESAQTQQCAPALTVSVTTLDVLRVEVIASRGHCSNLIVHVLVDGVERYVSGELAAGAGTGFQDLGPVDPGEHRVAVQGEGVLGGCNAGGVINWGGTLNVVVSTAPAVTPSPATSPTEGPTPSPAPGGAGSGGGDSPILLFLVVAGLLGAGALGYFLLRRRSGADDMATPPSSAYPPDPIAPPDPIIPPNPIVEADQAEPKG